jgi:hypothetical protein
MHQKISDIYQKNKPNPNVQNLSMVKLKLIDGTLKTIVSTDFLTIKYVLTTLTLRKDLFSGISVNNYDCFGWACFCCI